MVDYPVDADQQLNLAVGADEAFVADRYGSPELSAENMPWFASQINDVLGGSGLSHIDKLLSEGIITNPRYVARGAMNSADGTNVSERTAQYQYSDEQGYNYYIIPTSEKAKKAMEKGELATPIAGLYFEWGNKRVRLEAAVPQFPGFPALQAHFEEPGDDLDVEQSKQVTNDGKGYEFAKFMQDLLVATDPNTNLMLPPSDKRRQKIYERYADKIRDARSAVGATGMVMVNPI